MRRKSRLLQVVGLLVGLIFLFSTQNAFADQETQTSTHQSGMRDKKILVEMVPPATVALGQPVALAMTVQPLIDAPNVAVRWVLPEGVTLLDGPMEENLGTLTAGQTVSFVRQVRIDVAGSYKIGMDATFQLNAGVRYGDAAVRYFTVNEMGGSVSESDPNREARLREKIALGPDASVSVSTSGAQPNATNGTTCFDLTAQFTRQDKVFNGSSQVTNIVPITGLYIEIWEDDVVFDDLIDIVRPDANGNISYSTCDDDGFLGGGLEIYLGISALAEGDEGPPVAALEESPPLWVDLPDLPWGDDGLYNFETSNMDVDGSGSLNFGTIELNEEMSEAMNITESIYEAWDLWQKSDMDPGRTEYDIVDVYWSNDDGTGSYYVGILDNLYLKDTDGWDDSVIIHEWTHFADDKWGCDGNPGGDHDGVTLVDSELAWGEGYPDFYQMVVRSSLGDPFGDWYVDLNDLGTCSVCFDIENWHINFPSDRHVNNELSDAAALWDLIDATNEDQDQFTLPDGYPFVEKVFLHTFFVDANIGNCDFGSYFVSWKALGGPTDALAAAAIVQNTNFVDIFTTSSAATVAAVDSSENATVALDLADSNADHDYGWWERVAYIVDNSKSMAGERLDAVKSVLQDQVDETFEDTPQGVEVRMDTFNNTSSTNQPIFKGLFFPEDINPAIASVTASDVTDGGSCPVNAFGALKQTVAGESNLNAWLFTDNYPMATNSPLESFRAELVNRDISASFAVLQTTGGGNCLGSGSPNAPLLLRQKQLQRQLTFATGNAPSEPSNSIVPYLLTALATGGQFLFVEEDQMDDAADILQAQLHHSAGAGRWSDYVSTQPTYRWDRLASWEYAWVDGVTLGTALPGKPGDLSFEDYEDVLLPAPMLFYSRPVTVAHVYENGYLTFNDQFGEQPNNTEIPDAAVPNAALYPYWDDLEWGVILAAGADAVDAGEGGAIYTVQQGDWFVIQYNGYHSAFSTVSAYNTETFQVLLNLVTGEIRYQYDNIANGVEGATIGIESWPDFAPMDAIQVSYNDKDGAASGTGYKFMPVPPQPTKDYTVTVDSTMQSIGFLLTGFNGTLAPMQIRTPDNNLVECNTPGVFCTEVGSVQYKQVNVNGRTGLWKVNVQPGPSGSGTFAFSSMAAGPLAVSNPSNHTLPSFGNLNFTINLGQAVDGNQVDGHFLTPANESFGTPFVFFDDGTHGDGDAGDGLFGSEPVTPQAAGTAYLWVNGELDGKPFQRVETRPYTFQPLLLEGPTSAPALDAKTVVSFTLTNNDTVAHSFVVDVQVPDGWRGQLDLGGDVTVTLGAGASLVLPVAIWMGPTDPDSLNQPSGATGTVNVAAVEVEQGVLFTNAAVQITRHRLPDRIVIEELYPFLQVNTTAPVAFRVYDDQNYPVVDGTVLALSTTLGTLPSSTSTVNGFAEVTFATGGQVGAALVSAETLNGVSASRVISITAPMIERIVLSTTVSSLPADGTSTTLLLATVLDGNGAPVANQTVRIGLEGGGDAPGDNAIGTVNGSEVVTGTTNGAGQFQVTFKSGKIAGPAGLRAEWVYEGSPTESDRIEIMLGVQQRELVLPFIRRVDE